MNEELRMKNGQIPLSFRCVARNLLNKEVRMKSEEYWICRVKYKGQQTESRRALRLQARTAHRFLVNG